MNGKLVWADTLAPRLAAALATLLVGLPLWVLAWRPMLGTEGAVNLVLSDGHIELAPLETLWKFEWHLNYTTPIKRPD